MDKETTASRLRYLRQRSCQALLKLQKLLPEGESELLAKVVAPVHRNGKETMYLLGELDEIRRRSTGEVRSLLDEIRRERLATTEVERFLWSRQPSI